MLLVHDLLDFGPVETGWLFAYIGICSIIIQAGLIGRLVNGLGEMPVAIIGGALLISGQFITALLASYGLGPLGAGISAVMLSTSFLSFGVALINPTLIAAASKVAHEDEIGGSLGLVHGFGSIGLVIGLILAGPLYTIGKGSLTFGVGGGISCFLLGLFFVIMRSKAGSDA